MGVSLTVTDTLGVGVGDSVGAGGGDAADAEDTPTPPDAASTTAVATTIGRGTRRGGPPDPLDDTALGLSGFCSVTLFLHLV
ncbi:MULTISPECIES: hypothetical protein [unclassified Streptosporangium]|uniref:hypothetical protein n=1 Tax=unclassified Streptosporangium TaxID=2632669 RepID=UPI002E2A5F1E|nr:MULTISPECIES: hypothetical protein [unclassified Streptosporangium]